MPSTNTVLVIEDNIVNRKVLYKILEDEYNVLEAKNGEEGLAMLQANPQTAAVILDLVMPIMDGFAFMSKINEMPEFKDTPIIVSTGSNNQEDEKHALSLGAWDFVFKPYIPEILKFRLRHVIERSQMAAFERLKYLAEYDTLTDIYNKSKFSIAVRELLEGNPEYPFAFIRFDIDRFQLFNAFYGDEAGDAFLKCLAGKLKGLMKAYPLGVYGRMEADIFAVCVAYTSRDRLEQMIGQFVEFFGVYKSDFNIIPSFGIYYLDDYTIPVGIMLDRATLAARTCKGNYMNHIAVYQPAMSHELELQQEMVNEMLPALEGGQFCVYFQPKYNLMTGGLSGAEALVRWNHPQKGMISPGDFIPVFEANGFIARLDYYVWEKTCGFLAKWLREGSQPVPVSVNVSQVNFYNPNLVENLCKLVDAYHIPAGLLQLELTESAYMENPQIMQDVIHRLRGKGFPIHMDDFGSGYSSLNMLKNIEIDILKIDLGFLRDTDHSGRAENIIASIVRMAKWLGIPTVAEGVEDGHQAEFLRSIGCEYAQGYHYGRPMPAVDYEVLMAKEDRRVLSVDAPVFEADALWASNPQMEILFFNAILPSCICEFDNGYIDILRVNKAFDQLFEEDHAMSRRNPLKMVALEHQASVMASFETAIHTQDYGECEFCLKTEDHPPRWVDLKLKYISSLGNKQILMGTLADITGQKKIEAELKKYKKSLERDGNQTNQVLIVDDEESSRVILRTLIDPYFTVCEASNGKEAVKILSEKQNNIDLILLDIMMPQMDGLAFMEYRSAHDVLMDIPVIMITADDSVEQQIHTIAIGANDCITKPFIPEVALRRVLNVMEAKQRIQEIVRVYESTAIQAQLDPFTRLYNRQAIVEKISQALTEGGESLHTLIMLELENFKAINDGLGHHYGDQAILKLSEALKGFFRKVDFIGRYGGEEFCIFLEDMPSEDFVLKKCQDLCNTIDRIFLGESGVHLVCSLGIAISQGQRESFEDLYGKAEAALVHSKHQGENIATLYGEYLMVNAPEPIFNREWLIDVLDNAISIFSEETDEVLYMSRGAMALFDTVDYHGKKCYEVIQKRQSPCPFCIRDKLLEQDFYCWTCEHPILKRPFFLKDKRINYYGQKAHIQMVFDLTDVVSDSPISREVDAQYE